MAQGNTIEWLNALEMIRQLDADYLVPGHGPVCDAEATYRIEEYIRFMRSRVSDYYLAGKNKNETKSGLVGEMVEWYPIPPERKAKIESQIKSGLNRVYREIQREEESLADPSGANERYLRDDDDFALFDQDSSDDD